MLQKTEIREEILRIVKDGQSCILNTMSKIKNTNDCESKNKSMPPLSDTSVDVLQDAKDNAEKENRLLNNENNRLKAEMGEMRNKLRQAQDECLNAQNHIQTMESELQDCRNKIIKMSGALEEANQQAYNLQTDNDKWKQAYQAEKRKSDTLSVKLQNEINALKQDNQRLEQRKHSLEKANESLQSQMDQRFARGWELFEAYQNVDAHTKQLLHNGVFTQETNFMSFICGGAQTGSLEKLWDALKECIMYGQQKDAETLWDIFEYCIELVNSSKAQAKYEVLPSKEGDRFDPDIHTEGPNSLAQGKVLNVYLPGYQNTYNGKIIKKSIVQVG